MSEAKLIDIECLTQNLPAQYKLHYFEEMDSTNTYLKQFQQDGLVHICLSEMQKAGRGRFGREWLSPFAENIYCSIKFPLPIIQLESLSLRVGIMLAEFLKPLLDGHQVQLKWPNDVLVNGSKIAGILVELLGEKHTLTDAIIGIGINVNMQNATLDNQWTSLNLMSNRIFNRTKIAEKLLITIIETVESEESLDTSKWNQLDYLYQKNVSIKCEGKLLLGKVLGVSEDGGLQLLLETGEERVVYAGEASLHGS